MDDEVEDEDKLNQNSSYNHGGSQRIFEKSLKKMVEELVATASHAIYKIGRMEDKI